MYVHDQILEFLKITGPTIPTKVAKTIKTDIIIASAHLSDLAAQGKVRISSLKVGGSPLYYLAGQEEQLYQFAAGNLNPKDLAVLDRLKTEGVLKEASLDLLSKVALRVLKDFAVPLQVRTLDNSELFWKWHLLSDELTNQAVRDILYPPAKEETSAAGMPLLSPSVHEPVTAKPMISESGTADSVIQKPVISSPLPFLSSPLEMEWSGEELVKDTVMEPAGKELVIDEQPKKVRQKKTSNKVTDASQTVLAPKKSSSSLAEKTDNFLPAIEHFFRELNITIQEHNILRRNSEINLSIKVPTVVGKMTYFCKARRKNRCDEREISAAYLEAQAKKLPLLFLHSGELTKKAEEMVALGAFENLVVKRIN